MRILVVEDNRDILANVLDYLQLKGFTVDCAQDGLSGLHLATSQHYDLIVLDIMLPGTNGLDLCRSLRAESQVQVVMLTAKGRDTEVAKGLALGADAYVTKPFSTKDLVAKVKAMLAR